MPRPALLRLVRFGATMAALAGLGCERPRSPLPPPPLPAAGLPTTVVPAPAADATSRMAKFTVAPPFLVELAAAEPAFQNPVAFALDTHGRAFVAETNRYLQSVFDITQQTPWLRADLGFRTVADRRAFLLAKFAPEPDTLTSLADVVRMLQDKDGDGRMESTTLLPVPFQVAEAGPIAGVLAHEDAAGQTCLYVTCIPDLVRIDLSPSGVRWRTLHTGFGVHIGVSGHDLHGLVIGPDERLYFTVGDRGAVVTTPEGRHIDLPDTGAAFRCELDGSGLEVFATGLRNPQELAFDRSGNLITVDNDTAGTDPTRVLHLVEGGDYGWRTGYQHQQDFGLWQAERIWEGVDDVLPSAGQVAQGPAGLAYAPGVDLGPDLIDHFFVCDFPGGVRAFRLRPQGASFVAGDNRKILWGLWPTDVACGADGALYVSDWVQGWRKPELGRLYRLVDPTHRADAETRRTQDILAAGFARRGGSELVELLAHADMRVRQGAHFALAARPDANALLEGALAVGQPAARRLHALWACSIRARKGDAGAASRLLAACADADPELRAQALGGVGALPPDAVRSAAALAHLGDDDPRVRLYAALALARQRPRGTTPSVLERLRHDGDDAFLRHALVAALDVDEAIAATAGSMSSADLAVRRGLLLAERRARDPRIVAFLADPDPDLVAAAVRAIHDSPIDDAMPALVPLTGRTDLPVSVRARVLNACVRVGSAAAATALVTHAVAADGDPATRVSALQALARWQQPDAVDPVLGLWRPLPARSAAPAAKALASVLPALVAEATDDVVVAALASADALDVEGLDALARGLAADAARVPGLRAAALGIIAARRAPGWDELAAGLVARAAPELAPSFLEALASRLDPAPAATTRLVAALTALLTPDASLPVLQGALRLLATVPHTESAADARVDDAIAAASGLARQQARLRGLALDVRVAAAARGGPSLQRLLATWPGTDDELLAGGDGARGRRLFRDKPELQCLRCHAVGAEGGPVGPALDHIGRKPAAYLLQAVRDPSAVIAEGWPQGVPSAMPAGLDRSLTPLELRDLLAYLQGLK